jgi:hypothetical protein
MTPEQIEHAARFWQRNFGTSDIARFLNLDESTVYNALSQIRRTHFLKERAA